MHVRGWIVGLLSTLSLYGGMGCDSDSTKVSYERDIKPIFEGRCNICHHPTSAIGYDFTDPYNSETGIIGKENSWFANHDTQYELIVDPGNPENSSLLGKVRDPDLDPLVDGNKMPYRPEALTAEELTSVEAWINGGALDDASFEPVARIFGTEISLRPSLSGRCTWCHYPGSPTGLSVLDVFDSEEGMVNVESETEGILVIPGDAANSVLMKRLRGEGGARMPLHFTPLSDEEIQTITEWIVLGAPES